MVGCQFNLWLTAMTAYARKEIEFFDGQPVLRSKVAWSSLLLGIATTIVFNHQVHVLALPRLMTFSLGIFSGWIPLSILLVLGATVSFKMLAVRARSDLSYFRPNLRVFHSLLVVCLHPFLVDFFVAINKPIGLCAGLAARMKPIFFSLVFVVFRLLLLFFAFSTLFHGLSPRNRNRPKLSVPRWKKRGEGRHLPSQLWPTLILNV